MTVRYISQRGPDRSDGDIDCYCATIELPASRVGEKRRLVYVMLEVDPLTGAIGGFPSDLVPNESAANYARVQARLGERRVPDWDQLRRASHLAHACFPGIYAIAWDWALTPTGLLMLEGNGGWGVSTPQMLKGGLLAASAPRLRQEGPLATRISVRLRSLRPVPSPTSRRRRNGAV